jgi:Na+-translocating ferredoxin:NAD+ oxidoreductase RNF subunit RnfB
MLAMYEALVAGKGMPGDIERIERLAQAMKLGSLCDLGRSAPNPVLSTLRYFRDEYQAHIEKKACAAGTCRELTAFEVIPEPCNGCHACFTACPADAVTGERKKPHFIHQDKCISCGACYDACPVDAIRFFPETERKAA